LSIDDNHAILENSSAPVMATAGLTDILTDNILRNRSGSRKIRRGKNG
jgi:hypothetical protein